jgi:hypothetical protein
LGYFGGVYFVFAAFVGFYLMPSWMYQQRMFPISFPFGIIALLGATLVSADMRKAGGALLLTSSLGGALATVLFAGGILDPLVGAFFAGVAGVLAIHTVYTGGAQTAPESVEEANRL